MKSVNKRAVSLGMLLVFVFIGGCTPTTRVVPTVSPERLRYAAGENAADGRPVQALYQLEALGVRAGWTAAQHHEAGNLWAELGDDTRALFHWEQAARELDDVRLWRNLADMYMRHKAWPDATNALERLLVLQPDSTWASFYLGALLAPSVPLDAVPYLQQAALDPSYGVTARALRVAVLESQRAETLDGPLAAYRVGLVLVAHERWALAEFALEYANARSLAVNGIPFPEALAYQGWAQDKQGGDGTALLFEAIRLRPDDAQIRFVQALHHRDNEDYHASLNAVIQAVSLSPDTPALYAELGTAYRLVGNLEQAERWYRAAVAYSGDAPAFQQILQQFYAEEAFNLGSTGIAALDEALTTNPNDPDLLSGLGWTYYNLGDVDTAHEHIDRALSLSPSNHRAMYYKAMMLLEADEDRDRVRHLLEQVVAQDDRFSGDAARILAGL